MSQLTHLSDEPGPSVLRDTLDDRNWCYHRMEKLAELAEEALPHLKARDSDLYERTVAALETLKSDVINPWI
jgi:hypothetical protein